MVWNPNNPTYDPVTGQPLFGEQQEDSDWANSLVRQLERQAKEEAEANRRAEELRRREERERQQIQYLELQASEEAAKVDRDRRYAYKTDNKKLGDAGRDLDQAYDIRAGAEVEMRDWLKSMDGVAWAKENNYDTTSFHTNGWKSLERVLHPNRFPEKKGLLGGEVPDTSYYDRLLENPALIPALIPKDRYDSAKAWEDDDGSFLGPYVNRSQAVQGLPHKVSDYLGLQGYAEKDNEGWMRYDRQGFLAKGVQAGLEKLGASPTVAGMGGGIVEAVVPVVGQLSIASRERDPNSSQGELDLLEATLNTLFVTAGGPGAKIAKSVTKKVLGAFGRSGVEPGAKGVIVNRTLEALAQGGLNVATDTPLVIASLIDAGYTPEDPEFRKTLAVAGGISFGAGAAFPALSLGKPVVLPSSIVGGTVAATTASFIPGVSDEEAAKIGAGVVVGGTLGKVGYIIGSKVDTTRAGVTFNTGKPDKIPVGGLDEAGEYKGRPIIPDSRHSNISAEEVDKLLATAQVSKSIDPDRGEATTYLIDVDLQSGVKQLEFTDIGNREVKVVKYGEQGDFLDSYIGTGTLKDWVSHELSSSELKNPIPLANGRLLFHGTNSREFDLLDPEMGLGNRTGITRGPGIYLTADPEVVLDTYGARRIFGVEFDGEALDLTVPVPPNAPAFPNGKSWVDVAREIGELKVDGVSLRDLEPGHYDNFDNGSMLEAYDVRWAGADRATKDMTPQGLVANGYIYYSMIEDLLNTPTIRNLNPDDFDKLLGKFKGLARNNNASSEDIAKGIISNHISKQGVDAFFHHSPRSDGEVFIVLNGEKARIVYDIDPKSLSKKEPTPGTTRNTYEDREATDLSLPAVREAVAKEAVANEGTEPLRWTDRDNHSSLSVRNKEGDWVAYGNIQARRGDTGMRYLNTNTYEQFDNLAEAKLALETPVRNGKLVLRVEPPTTEGRSRLGFIHYPNGTGSTFADIRLKGPGQFEAFMAKQLQTEQKKYTADLASNKIKPRQTSRVLAFTGENAKDIAKSPITQQLAGTAGSAVYGFLNPDEDQSRLEGAGTAAAVSLAAGLGGRAAGLTSDPTLKRIFGIDTTAQAAKKKFDDHFRKTYDRLGFGTPADIMDAIAASDEQVGGGLAAKLKNITEKDIPIISGITNIPESVLRIDPREQYHETVIRMAVVQQNILSQYLKTLPERALSIQEFIDKVRGESGFKRVRREAVSFSPLALSVVGLLADEELPEDVRTALIMGGAAGAGRLNKDRNKLPGVRLGRKFLQYGLAAPRVVVVDNPDGTRTVKRLTPSNANYDKVKAADDWFKRHDPEARLAYMADNPQDFVLPTDVADAFLASRQYLGEAQTALNAAREMAGLEPFPFRENRGSHEIIDWEGFIKNYPNMKRPPTLTAVNLPRILATPEVDKPRTLGDNVYDIAWGGKLKSFDPRDPNTMPYSKVKMKGTLEEAMLSDVSQKLRALSSAAGLTTLFHQPEGKGGHVNIAERNRLEAELLKARENFRKIDRQYRKATKKRNIKDNRITRKRNIVQEPGFIMPGRGHDWANRHDPSINSTNSFPKGKPNTRYTEGTNEYQLAMETAGLLGSPAPKAPHETGVDDFRSVAPDWIAARDKVAQYDNTLKSETARLRKLGWNEQWKAFPGSTFVNQAIDTKLIEDIGKFWPDFKETGFMSMADKATSELRQLLMVMDGSAWTINGAMVAANDPAGTIRSSPALFATSVLGDVYIARWLRNPENAESVKRLSDAGLINGRMVDELSSSDSFLKRHVGGVRQIEARGFQQFLPMMRILTAMHMVHGEALREFTGKGKVAGYLLGNDVATLTDNFLRYGLPVGAGVLLEDRMDLDGWEHLFTAALVGGGAVGISKGMDVMGKARYDRMTPEQKRTIEVRVSRQINRSSGVLHRGQLGINPNKARVERVFMANSPAFLRNTFSALKVSLEGTGPEAAMARAYLYKTAFVAASSMVGLKYLFTGEGDSLDPSDEESVLSLPGFMKAGLGTLGTVSTAFPHLSLIRAVIQPPYVEGKDSNITDMELGESAKNFFNTLKNRSPVLSGQIYKSLTGQESSFGNAIRSGGDSQKLREAGTEMFVPLPFQPVADKLTPGLERIGGNPLFGIDPNINTPGERRTGLEFGLAGATWNPESLSKEATRKTDALIRRLAGGGGLGKVEDQDKDDLYEFSQLDEKQRTVIKSQPEWKEIEALREKAEGLREPDDDDKLVDSYRESVKLPVNTRVATIRDIDSKLASGEITKRQALSLYNQAQADYTAQKELIEADQGAKKLGRKVYRDGKLVEQTVAERLGEYPTTNESALDGYYKLFDTAEGPDGQVDFEKLENSQAGYLRSLPSEQLEYVEYELDRVKTRGIADSDGNPVVSKFLQEYEAVKLKTRPYFEAGNKEFAQLQKADKFFKEFSSYEDFRDTVTDTSNRTGITSSVIYGDIALKHGAFKQFQTQVDMAKEKLRANVDLDIMLWEFYGRNPLNPMAIIARKAGSKEWDAYSQYLATPRAQRPPREMILAVAAQYGLRDLGAKLIELSEE